MTLEVRVDGGGGEEQRQVVALARRWAWRHGAKVGQGQVQVFTSPGSGGGPQEPWSDRQLEESMATPGAGPGWSDLLLQEQELGVVLEDDAEVSPHW